MNNLCTMDVTAPNTTCGKTCKQQTETNAPDKVFNWINSSNFGDDDDTNSIYSDSTAVSSSLVESEDNDFDFGFLSLEDSSDSRKMSSTSSSGQTNVMNKVDLLQHIFNKDSSVQTVGNVHIENSSQVHIGNVTHVHITNPNKRYMKMLFNNNTKTVPPSYQKPKVPTQQEEEEVSQREEANRDDAFLGNIKRRAPGGILRFIDRRTWLAQKPMEEYERITQPVEYVVISHSATEMATTQADNIYLIRNIQCFHVESRRWNDIAYNFMIGCDGNVYQGRGWGVVGAHTQGYNTFSVGICFIGCFMRELPPAVSLKACQNIIQKGIDSGYIVPNYKLIGHCQCSPTESPGRKLFEEIKKWEHFCADIDTEL